ncbi:arylsulfatase [Bacteroides caccae]|jgi:arylsulfatase A-like enzyme|uniref:arylsulfatase n=1 Tax=Bacteroides caccae TaxID=47678 RepID=UPI001C9DCE68|nr:arylsulfatase [Bacteroides caccae]
MDKYSFIGISSIAITMSPCITGCIELEEEVRPNIILILADDLGFSDLECYGGEINTPNLSRMAREGLRYTQFYNAGRSCPSRASLLTGLTPHQAGIGHMTYSLGYHSYKGDLHKNTVTLAEALKNCGYQTGMSGKWHVTSNIEADKDISNFPLQRGFDRFYGTIAGYGSFFDPISLYEGNTPVKAEGDYYYTEAITDYAVSCINDFSKKENPFFMYIAYTAPHYPIHAREEYIQKYKGKFHEGWDSLRVKRIEKMKTLGIIPDTAILSERDEQSYPWEDEKNKAWQEHRMEVYAAMVEQMDEGIGKVLDALERNKKLDNTLVIFLSDNGASSEGHLYNKVERTGEEWKSKLIPKYNKKGEKVKPGDFPNRELGNDTTFGSYGAQWANMSVTPFRRYKSWMHEGGIRTPMIAYWKGKIIDCGALRTGVYNITDFMPTFLELAEDEYPSEIRGVTTQKPEGISLVESFTKDVQMTRNLYWEHEGNKAIRSGKWKLVSEFPGSWKSMRSYPKNGKWELYDMDKDPVELNDLSEKYPEIVDSLASEWNKWAERTGVKDWSLIGEGNL